MTLSDKKLYCGDRQKNIIKSKVNLYTVLSDVQNQGKAFNFNGQTLYAKWGEVNNPKSSNIRVKINDGAKTLLTSANTTWNFENTKSSVEIDGYSHNIQKNSINLKARYKDNDGNWLGELSQSCVLLFEFTIPLNSKKVTMTMEYNCTQAGCCYCINISKDYWNNSNRRLFELSGNNIERVTIEKGTETGYWDDINGHPIIPGKWSRGTVSTNLSTGWYGIEFRIDSTDLASYAGTFSIGQFKIEFEEN